MGKPVIKVLTGQRRVGKSYIIYQLMDEIARLDKGVAIQYINKELHEFRSIRRSEDLHAYVSQGLQPGKRNAVFIDEVQEIEDFEDALRSLLAQGCCDIYCTGSNAQLLSGDLASRLAGRCMEFRIHPLSYREFLRFHGREDSDDSLAAYLRFGGLPYLPVIGLEEARVFEYLENIHASIILRDVVAREKIRNVDFLETLVEYLADNVGNLFSATNIGKYLRSQRIPMTVPTILSYLSALRNAFIIQRVGRADIKGLKLFEIGEKWYFEDLGLRNAARGRSMPPEPGKLVENAVFIHLVERGFDLKVGQLDRGEIDFVARKGDRLMYVQAAYLLADAATVEREFGSLLRINDNYPKCVVSMDPLVEKAGMKGVRHLRLRDFLLDDLEDWK